MTDKGNVNETKRKRGNNGERDQTCQNNWQQGDICKK